MIGGENPFSPVHWRQESPDPLKDRMLTNLFNQFNSLVRHNWLCQGPTMVASTKVLLTKGAETICQIVLKLFSSAPCTEVTICLSCKWWIGILLNCTHLCKKSKPKWYLASLVKNWFENINATYLPTTDLQSHGIRHKSHPI